MSDALIRTPAELKQDVANYQLLFSVQKYVVEEILAKLSEADYMRLAEEKEIVIPIDDPDTIVSLAIIDDQIGDFISLVASLDQLGEELKISFDISRGEEFEDDEFDSDDCDYSLSISAFPNQNKGPLFPEEIRIEITPLTARDKQIIAASDWQEENSDRN